ncbi:unnamed protein product [marine sediment metagenome]|uniref:Uncharacterized protein n=1 Tax=marine sediment metagenome TaxID=412755 RepID=X1S9H9_9ZZZZ
MEKILFTTNSQKILEFLIQAPGEEYLSREIQIAVKISKAGITDHPPYFPDRSPIRIGMTYSLILPQQMP